MTVFSHSLTDRYRRSRLFLLLILFCGFFFGPAPAAFAQTPADTHWDNRFGYIGIVGDAAVEADRVVVMGHFPCIGETDPDENGEEGYHLHTCAFGIWDGNGWRLTAPMQQGHSITGPMALGLSGNDMYVGSTITTVDGHTIPNIAVWQGTEWQPLMTGVNGTVYALRAHETGLYVGGQFTEAGGQPANFIARYAPGWQPLIMDQEANGVSDPVQTLTSTVTNIYLGGGFTNAGNLVGVNCVARWDIGQQTFARVTPIGSTSLPCLQTSGGSPRKMINAAGGLYALLQSGSLYQLDGEEWVEIVYSPDPTFPFFGDFYVALSGLIYVYRPGFGVSEYLVWDGTSWQSVGVGARSWLGGRFVTGHNDEIYAEVGDLLDDRRMHGIGRWDGNDWNVMGQGLGQWDQPDGDIPVYALVYGEGTLYAAGDFRFAGDKPAKGMARWDDNRWVPIAGVPIPDQQRPNIRAMVVDDNGIIIGGHIPPDGSEAYNGIARWDGTDWHSLGEGPGVFGSAVYALHRMGGDLYAGGDFQYTAGGGPAGRIARWDGSTWHTLDSGLGNGIVYALTSHEGKLYVGGGFSQFGDFMPARNVAVWDGSAWSNLGDIGPNEFGTVTALVIYDGELYAAYNPYGLFRWDGTEWHQIAEFSRFSQGIPSVHSLHVNGDELYVGGDFTHVNGQRAWGVARWNGEGWSGLGSGIWNSGSTTILEGIAYAIAGSSEGLWIGGKFIRAGNTPAMNIALWHDFDYVTSGEPSPQPRSYSLSAPYPNPARHMATVELSISTLEYVRVAMYDVLGRRVAVVHDGFLEAGTSHELSVSLTSLAAGVYIIRAEGAGFVATQRLTVIR